MQMPTIVRVSETLAAARIATPTMPVNTGHTTFARGHVGTAFASRVRTAGPRVVNEE